MLLKTRCIWSIQAIQFFNPKFSANWIEIFKLRNFGTLDRLRHRMWFYCRVTSLSWQKLEMMVLRPIKKSIDHRKPASIFSLVSDNSARKTLMDFLNALPLRRKQPHCSRFWITVAFSISIQSRDSISSLLCHSISFNSTNDRYGATVEIESRNETLMGEATVSTKSTTVVTYFFLVDIKHREVSPDQWQDITSLEDAR